MVAESQRCGHKMHEPTHLLVFNHASLPPSLVTDKMCGSADGDVLCAGHPAVASPISGLSCERVWVEGAPRDVRFVRQEGYARQPSTSFPQRCGPQGQAH